MVDMSDPFKLSRFVEAQQSVYERALDEIGGGRKRSHWMWFIFPQIAGLGSSDMARRYAIGSLPEARAYLDHDLLGDRYRACVQALQDLGEHDPEAVFGAVDAAKLRSSLTLFELADAPPLIGAAIDRWFDGDRDKATMELISWPSRRLRRISSPRIGQSAASCARDCGYQALSHFRHRENGIDARNSASVEEI